MVAQKAVRWDASQHNSHRGNRIYHHMLFRGTPLGHPLAQNPKNTPSKTLIPKDPKPKPNILQPQEAKPSPSLKKPETRCKSQTQEI